MSPRYAGVIIDTPHSKVDRLFHYIIPPELHDKVKPGYRVFVPFGNSDKLIKAYVLEVSHTTPLMPEKLKPISEVKEDYPLLLPEFIPIIQWMKKEYHCLTIDVIRCFVPNLSKSMAYKTSSNGNVTEEFSDESEIVLTAEQQSAILLMNQALLEKRGNFILEGVTGSGKTEVYIRLAQIASEQGRQTIILVPEISLTPQTVERFKTRFGSQVSILHSRLAASERLKHWHNVRIGLTKIVVGTRSAVFAPVSNLGMIIIDEAHDDSFKSDQRPRYHTIDVARKRCEIEGGILVLGSATPRIEDSFLEGKVYKKILMTQRVEQRSMPPVKVIDMREEIVQGNRSVISSCLHKALNQVLEKREQAIILINRRGYAQFVLCRSCGFVVMCKNCNMSLTYHQEGNLLKCHYCGSRKGYPTVCPSCKSSYIKNFGLGTQKVQEELSRFFPNAKIIRMDMDSTTKKNSHQIILESFKQGEHDILIGTQMIAKGLDFPNVTLVGVISADASLNLPDYRNSEKTFQLIAQVAGRTGRGAKGGEVIVQTYQPKHYAIELASRHDYSGFYEKEIKIREMAKFPPITHIVRILMTGENKISLSAMCKNSAQVLKEKIAMLKELMENVLEVGAYPAPLEKFNNKYRWQILIKIKRNEKAFDLLHSVVDDLCSSLPVSPERVIIDFYPVSLL